MKNVLALNTLRSIKRSPGRFAAIMLIIAIGCAFYSGVKTASPDMKDSAWDYYRDYSLADIQLKSTLGFNEDDLDDLLNNECFSEGYAGYSADLFVKSNDGGSAAVSVMSYSESYPLNKILLREGRLPQNANECLADIRTKQGVSFAVGDKLTLYSDESRELSDIVSNDEYTVVGLIESPLYVSFDRGVTTIGNGTLYGFLYIPEENFAYECPTDIYLSVTGADLCKPFSDEYEQIVENAETVCEEAADERLGLRVDSISSEAYATINDAKAELDDAQKKYDSGSREYNDGLNEYNKAYDDYSTIKAQYDEAVAQYEDSIAEIEAVEANVAELEFTCTEIDNYLEIYKDKYIKTLPTQMLDSVRNYQEIYDKNRIEVQITELLAVFLITDPEKDPGGKLGAYQAIVDVNEQVKAVVEKMRSNSYVQRAAIEKGTKELDGTAVILNEYEAQLSESKTKLDEAKIELDDARIKIDDANAEIADAEADLEESLSDRKWYVWNRSEFNPDCMEYGNDADRIEAISNVFPVFFILIAALVCCTTMSRMVEEDRTQAGTLKVLGYSAVSIVMQYVLYAVSASVIGALIGTAVGFQLLPNVIFNAYCTMYSYPYFSSPFKPLFALACIGVSILCTCAATIYTAAGELHIMPAQLIRPKAPKNGKRIWIEKIKFIWNHMSFSDKVTHRNLLRYKSRFFVTVIGVAGCTALLLAGFGLRYAISSIVDKQYGQLFTYEAIAVTDKNSSDEERSDLHAYLDNSSDVLSHMDVIQETVDAYSENGEFECYVFVPKEIDKMQDYITLRDRETHTPVPMSSDGAVISEKLARLLGVSAGGSFRLGDSPEKLTVSGICENYASNYIYITYDTYARIFGESESNMTLIKSDTPESDEFSSGVLSNDCVVSFAYLNKGADTFKKLVSSMNLIILVIIGFAGVLTFVILFNLINITINERMRELATIKVLGFFNGEVCSYVYRENIISSCVGIILGLVVGVYLERFVIRMSEVDSVMFSPEIPPYCFAMAALVTALFALIVNIVMYFRIRKIDMAASMKAIE
ncbi:MAG: FtsX-like permease family protein [Huintestinicola sp.]